MKLLMLKISIFSAALLVSGSSALAAYDDFPVPRGFYIQGEPGGRIPATGCPQGEPNARCYEYRGQASTDNTTPSSMIGKGLVTWLCSESGGCGRGCGGTATKRKCEMKSMEMYSDRNPKMKKEEEELAHAQHGDSHARDAIMGGVTQKPEVDQPGHYTTGMNAAAARFYRTSGRR